MRQSILLVSLAAIVSVPALAKNTQQEVMKSCNVAADGKKGQERKDFMKGCLSDGRMAQREKMKTCNADAAGKKGDHRKAFMKECLSK
ncbi:PsiF repeat protein [Ottowia sp. GY511]|uniref:PsiF family protein n=1 Tax=Ottowia flava TaxID=2675430 RepID=A0ABW4L153_9BURK|nr:PsiF family protein [Ottowia sp. GY511]TXK23410.1 PsiF repeat protein [Ottowia sp. GY511]